MVMRSGWMAIGLTTAAVACGKFGDYTTTPGSGGTDGAGAGSTISGSTDVGQSAQSGAGGAGGAANVCATVTCSVSCQSQEDCKTIAGETMPGNKVCGEPDGLNSVSHTPDLDKFYVRSVFRKGASSSAMFAGTKVANGAGLFFFRDPDLPAVGTETMTYESGNVAGARRLTGWVSPIVGQEAVGSWVLGRGVGNVFGQVGVVNPMAFAQRFTFDGGNVMPGDPFAPAALESRFLAGALTYDGASNTVLNVLALHDSDFGSLMPYPGGAHLSMLRAKTPFTRATIDGGTCVDATWRDSTQLIPAGMAAIASDTAVYFGIGLCNKMVLGAWDGTDNATITPVQLPVTPNEVTVAGLHALSRNSADQHRILVVGTFQGSLRFAGGDEVASTGPAPNHDVFIAVFDTNFGLKQFAHFGGAGDVRVHAIDVFMDESENLTVFLGGWLNGDVSWGCFNGDTQSQTQQAFLARVSMGKVDQGPIRPMFVKNYGMSNGDSRITSLAYLGGELWATGEILSGSVNVHPDTTVSNSIISGNSNATFAMRVKPDTAFNPN